MPMLSADAIASFRETGFYFPIRIMPPEAALAIGQQVMAFTGSETARRYPDANNQIYLLKAHLLFAWADRIAHTPALLDAVEDLLGPDIMVWSSGVFWKAPRTGNFVSWHQDSTNYELDDAQGVVRAWVSLGPATLENGTMRFLPGSHRLGQLRHLDTVQDKGLLSRGETLDLDIDESRTVPVLVDAGEASFHHLYTAHASGPNGADYPRVNYVITYIRPSLRPLGGRDSAVLARGQDRYGHFAHEPRPIADFHPDAMRAHREAMRLRNAITFRNHPKPPALPPHPV